MNINYREYSTKATPPPQQNNIKILNEILSEGFGEQEHSLDQWTLNVIQTVCVGCYNFRAREPPKRN